MKKMIALLGFTVLLGAGCWSASDSNPPAGSPATPTPPGTPATSTTPPTSDNGSVTPPTEGAWMNVRMDDTWKTYTNAALKFSFQWPTRGSLAPQWSVKFAKAEDPAIKEGCYQPMDSSGLPSTKAMFNGTGVSFCHVSVQEGAAGTTHVNDYFATKNGNQYVVVSFTKQAYGGDLCKDGSMSTNNQACVPFNSADYQNLLLRIVSTFKYQP